MSTGISLPSGEIGVDIFEVCVKLESSGSWIDISDEVTTVSGLDVASSGIETVKIPTGSGRKVSFQSTPGDVGILSTKVDLLFNVLSVSFYDILLVAWQDAREKNEFPDIWFRIRPGNNAATRRYFYTSKDWQSLGPGKVTSFSYYSELNASTSNDIVRNSFTISYDAVYTTVSGRSNTQTKNVNTSDSITVAEYLGRNPEVIKTPVSGEDFDDVVALGEAHILNRELKLSTVPLISSVRVVAMGIPQWETRGDFITVLRDGEGYISWAGKNLESLLEKDDILEINYVAE